jgi:hypothetical protein
MFLILDIINNNIEELIIDGDLLQKYDDLILSSVLDNTSIKFLSYEYYLGIDDLIYDIIRLNKTITRIDLLCYLDFEKLNESLKFNDTIKTLTIGFQPYDNQTKLKLNNTINHLYIINSPTSSIEIEESNVNILGLTGMNINLNEITETILNKLDALTINHNVVTDNFLNLISENKTIKHLTLNNCFISDRNLECINNLLINNTTLIELDLSENDITEKINDNRVILRDNLA